MTHSASLISTIAICFVLAFCFGFAAQRLRLPPLVGYLVAGVAVGPFTPGIVADAEMAAQLAEVGVILLMFGVGLHFSPADLRAVRGIAIPGAIAVMAVTTAIGAALAASWGWHTGGAIVFGLCLSVASTVVLLRALEERNTLTSSSGRIAVGWLIVEDLVMVLVLLPALAGMAGGQTAADQASSSGGALALSLAITLGKVAAFVTLAMVLGPRVVPWLLKQVARTGSRELFTLSVLALAIGIAYGSAELFGVSFALGAFFAGVVLSESQFGHRAAAQSMPMQDAFAVLFFVSVGMLFNPHVLISHPGGVAAVVAVVIFGKALAALAVVMVLGYPVLTGLSMAAALARIGEFSFILAGLGISTGVMPVEGRDLIVAAALISITLSSLVFAATDALVPVVRTIHGLRGYGQRRLARLQDELDVVLRKAEAREEEHSVEIRNIVDLFPVFGELDKHAMEDLLLLFQPASANPGDRVLRKGDKATAAYFIASGAVQVSAAGREILLGPGEFFGEMALLSGARRSANVTAIDFCQFFMLTRRDFNSFLARHPGLRARIEEVVSSRQEMNRN